MNVAITIELKLFLLSVLWGAIILIIYDAIRILRRLIKHNNILVIIQDVIFWVIVSILIFAMFYVNNDGIIRGFSVVGLGIGMILYHYILSDWVVNNITRFIHIITRPTKKLISFVKKLLCRIINRLKFLIKSILLRLKKTNKSVKIAMEARRKNDFKT